MQDYLNPRTFDKIQRYIKKPAHSLILSGQSMMGQDLLVDELKEQLLGKISTDPRATLDIEPIDDKSIGIEQIHQINSFMQFKSGGSAVSKIIYINAVNGITTESQNALLKIIEEPIAGTVFIAVVESDNELLGTILSRSQVIELLPLTLGQSSNLCTILPLAEKNKLFALSAGRYDLLKSLLSDPKHLLFSQAETVKQFIKNTSYDRLTLAKEFESAEKLETLINMSEIICKSALKTSSTTTIDVWRKKLEVVINAKEMLAVSVNNKILYTWLSLNL